VSSAQGDGTQVDVHPLRLMEVTSAILLSPKQSVNLELTTPVVEKFETPGGAIRLCAFEAFVFTQSAWQRL
jgi:hypothetical protein